MLGGDVCLPGLVMHFFLSFYVFLKDGINCCQF